MNNESDNAKVGIILLVYKRDKYISTQTRTARAYFDTCVTM